jgi:hypothetical protein
MEEVTYEVWQDGLMIASVRGPREGALRNALHYLFLYGKDGGQCAIKASSAYALDAIIALLTPTPASDPQS